MGYTQYRMELTTASLDLFNLNRGSLLASTRDGIALILLAYGEVFADTLESVRQEEAWFDKRVWILSVYCE